MLRRMGTRAVLLSTGPGFGAITTFPVPATVLSQTASASVTQQTAALRAAGVFAATKSLLDPSRQAIAATNTHNAANVTEATTASGPANSRTSSADAQDPTGVTVANVTTTASGPANIPWRGWSWWQSLKEITNSQQTVLAAFVTLVFGLVSYLVISALQYCALRFFVWRFVGKVCNGDLATTPAYPTVVEDDFVCKLGPHPMQLVVGHKAGGKTTSASKAGKDRKNTIFVNIDDTNPPLTCEAALEQVYDDSIKKLKQVMYVPGVPSHNKLDLMEEVLKRATDTSGKPPTIIFDVHGEARRTDEAKNFVATLKMLQAENKLCRVIMTASEGKEYALYAKRDPRWLVVPVNEISADTAKEYIEKTYTVASKEEQPLSDEEKVKIDKTKLEMLTLMPKTPLTPHALIGGPDLMKQNAKSNTEAFLRAFHISSTDDATRKKFAEQALRGFSNPKDTALKDTIIECVGGSESVKVDEWFYNRFVATNVMAKGIVKYEFQFDSTKRLAEMLVAQKGDIEKLMKELVKKEWI